MKKSTKHSSNNVCGRGKRIVAFALSAVFLTACCPIAFAAEDSSAPLTPEQISGMTNEQLAAIPQEQSDATLSKIAQLALDGKKVTLNKYLSALGFEIFDEKRKEQEQTTLDTGIRPLWESDYAENGNGNPYEQCHDAITLSGFLVYMAARNKLFNGGTFGYTLSEMNMLSTESAWPDSGDKGFLWDRHFYDPDTQRSWRPNSATARDRAEFYYEEAVSKFNSSRTESIKNLAYCLHYIQDVAVPHHAANKVVGSSNHKEFETLASHMLLGDETGDEIKLEIDLEEDFDYDINFYNDRVSQYVGLFAHEIATTSKSLISVASNVTNIPGQRIVIAFMLNYSMQNTSGVLYKFAKEVGMI